MILRFLLDALLALVVLWFLDRRLARIEYWLQPEEAAPAMPDRLAVVMEEPPPPELPAQCPGMRGAMRCTRDEGHEGSHSGRAGVSWG